MEKTMIRMKITPATQVYADADGRRLTIQFAIPGAPVDTIELKMLENSVHLSAPAGIIDYVTALTLWSSVNIDGAEATYQHGLLTISVPFKDPMQGAVKIPIKETAPSPATAPGQQKGASLERQRAA